MTCTYYLSISKLYIIITISGQWSEATVMDFLIPIEFKNEIGRIQKMFRCDLCKKVNKDKSNMKKHMIIVHAEPSQLPCPYHCGKIFKNKIYLNLHVNSKSCIRDKKFPQQQQYQY